MIAPLNDVKLGVRHTATLEGPKTDSEADLTISGEFLKLIKSVWSEILACLAHKIMAELDIGTLPASVRKGARMGAQERRHWGIEVVAGAMLKRAPEVY